MKKLVLFLALAGACAAQTSPIIVKAVNLANETQFAGSLKFPVAFYTPSQDGFYRMTMSISTESKQGIEICPTLMGNPVSGCTSGSSVFAFGAKAGSVIGFCTDSSYLPYTSTYNVNLVLELLSEARPGN